MYKSIFATAAIAAIAAANSNSDDTKGIFGTDEQWKTGFVTIDSHKDDIFYWFYESRNDATKDPLVLWLTGGPGCASEIALFYENGPFHFKEDSTLESNQWSWNNNANLLYVDQPIGTGYSQGGTHDVRTEKEVAADMGIMLQGWLK